MLLPVFYIITQIENSTVKLNGNEILACSSSLFYNSGTAPILSKLFTQPVSKFCLLIDDNTIQNANTMMFALFHPSYFFSGPLTPCFLVSSKLDDIQSIQSLLTDLALAQGFNTPAFFIVDQHAADLTSITYLSTENDKHRYRNALETNYSGRFGIAVNLNSEESLSETRKMIEETEASLHETNPMYFELLHHIKKLRDQDAEMQKNHLQLRSKLKSLAQYDFDTNENTNFTNQQVKAINEFYKYEYEILPKWYKQFGHILKVIMGKRSFRSLYRDNVKKYKG